VQRSDRSDAPRRRGRPPVDAAEAEDTRERILDVAAVLFRERGYEGTSVREIAMGVGISAPALYWHFASKQEILFAFMESSQERFNEDLEVGAVGVTNAEKLRGFVEAHVQSQLSQRADTYDVLFGYDQLTGSLSEEQKARLVELQRVVVDMLRRILRDGQRRENFRFGDLTTTAFAIITMCEAVYFWAKPGGRLSVKRIAAEYGDIAQAIVGVPRSTPAKRKAGARTTKPAKAAGTKSGHVASRA
jgi:AcrR family transcriptional regulator